MNREEIKSVLVEHGKWSRGEGGKRADLRCADLRGADLIHADLSGAVLTRADLSGAVLPHADLRCADLIGANLRGADLRGADLRGADLRDADLIHADLSGADLRGADLRGAVLTHADLHGAKNIPAIAAARLEILPRIGTVRGWKKCIGGVLVEVEVPPDARRSNATGRKCRAEAVKVISTSTGETARSIWDRVTLYTPGAVTRCDEWCEDRWIECGGGIHFYLTKEEAEAHE